MKRRWIIIAVIPLILLISLGLWAYRDLHASVAHAKSNEYIEIPRGSTPEGIANKLVAEGVLRHKWPLLWYAKLTGTTNVIRAGESRVASPISPLGVLHELE